MNERRFRTMPPHRLMPYSIPPYIRAGRKPGEAQSGSIVRQSADDPYGAGFHGDVLKHVVKKPLSVNGRSKFVDEYIGYVDVIPGEQLFVIAQLSRVIIEGGFIHQPAKGPTDSLVLTAKAKIGLNQEGFFAILTGDKILKMRVGDAAGLRQEVRVNMPSYNPNSLVVEYRNSLVIVSV